MTKEERNALLYKPQNGLDRISAVEEAEMNDYCEQYKAFLDVSKTERECVVSAIRLAEAKGFKPYTPGMAVAPGDKLYYNNRGKAIMLMIIGQKPLSEGANIGAAHTDVAAARPQAQSALRGCRAGLPQDAPLRRRPQIPVGHRPARAARPCRPPRRQRSLRQDRRRPQGSPARHQRSAPAPWPRTGQKAPQ